MDKLSQKPRDVNLSGEIEDFLDFRNVHPFRMTKNRETRFLSSQKSTIESGFLVISKIGTLVQIFKISQIVPISYIAKNACVFATLKFTWNFKGCGIRNWVPIPQS